jgi:hypothetical protein
MILWGELGWERYEQIISGTPATEVDQSLDKATERMNMFHRFVHVQGMTPDPIPYWQGVSYEYLLYIWIPRIIWAEKPNPSVVVDRLDTAYLLTPERNSTSVGIGFLPEAYINFGELGVAIILFIQGVIFALLGSLLNRPGNDGGQAIYLIIMFPFLITIGFSATLAFGALVQTTIVYILVFKFFLAAPVKEPVPARVATRVPGTRPPSYPKLPK